MSARVGGGIWGVAPRGWGSGGGGGAGMRAAAVDIGTNTARLLVADVGEGRVVDLERRAEVVALGEGVDRSGRLSEAAVGRAVVLLAECGAVVSRSQVGAIRVVATSATRDAANATSFLDAAEQGLGRGPEVT